MPVVATYQGQNMRLEPPGLSPKRLQAPQTTPRHFWSGQERCAVIITCTWESFLRKSTFCWGALCFPAFRIMNPSGS